MKQRERKKSETWEKGNQRNKEMKDMKNREKEAEKGRSEKHTYKKERNLKRKEGRDMRE